MDFVKIVGQEYVLKYIIILVCYAVKLSQLRTEYLKHVTFSTSKQIPSGVAQKYISLPLLLQLDARKFCS